MDEWRLYPALTAYWAERGFSTASQVTDPAGARWEVDVAAFTPEMDDVRVTEVKLDACGAFVHQCLDRLEMAPRVYAALPAHRAEAMLEAASDGAAAVLGVLAVAGDGVELVREARATDEHRHTARAHVLERVLRGTLV